MPVAHYNKLSYVIPGNVFECLLTVSMKHGRVAIMHPHSPQPPRKWPQGKTHAHQLCVKECSGV